MAWLSAPSGGNRFSPSGHRQSLNLNKWREWPFVKVEVFGLPEDVTTLEIHRNFKDYGHVDSIIIKHNDRNTNRKNADVRFRLVDYFKEAMGLGRLTRTIGLPPRLLFGLLPTALCPSVSIQMEAQTPRSSCQCESRSLRGR